MATVKPSRSAQRLMVASVQFSIGDTLSDGAVPTPVTEVFGATGNPAWKGIKLPKGARVTGGAMTVTVAANDSGTQTIAIGDSGSASRYLSATTIKSAARTALVPTGYTGTGEDIQFTFVNTNGDATVGTVQVDVHFVIDGKADDVVPN